MRGAIIQAVKVAQKLLLFLSLCREDTEEIQDVIIIIIITILVSFIYCLISPPPCHTRRRQGWQFPSAPNVKSGDTIRDRRRNQTYTNAIVQRESWHPLGPCMKMQTQSISRDVMILTMCRTSLGHDPTRHLKLQRGGCACNVTEQRIFVDGHFSRLKREGGRSLSLSLAD